MKKSLLLSAALITLMVLTSCVTMNTEITIESNGEVTALLNYKISQYVMGFGRIDSEDPFIPLPVQEEDFRQRALQIAGTEYSDYSFKEDEDYAYITAKIECESVESLAQFLNLEISLNESGGDRTLSYVLVSEKDEAIKQEHKDLAEVLFSEDTISLTINTPGAISSYSNGMLSDNRRSLVFSQDILSMITSTDEIKLELTYETGR